MIELMLARAKRKVNSIYLVDIGFDDQPVGSKAIVNKGTYPLNLTRQVLSGNTDQDGVVNHPTFGKCYFNTGYSYFADDAARINIYNKDYEINAEVAFSGTSGSGKVFSTGDYNGPIKAGSVLVGNNASTQSFQYFQTNSQGSFLRVLLTDTPVANTLERIRIRKVGSTITITNLRTGKTNSYTAFDTGGDSYFRLFATHATNNALNGYFKRLTIQLL